MEKLVPYHDPFHLGVEIGTEEAAVQLLKKISRHNFLIATIDEAQFFGFYFPLKHRA
jgi:hypothetical protein